MGGEEVGEKAWRKQCSREGVRASCRGLHERLRGRDGEEWRLEVDCRGVEPAELGRRRGLRNGADLRAMLCRLSGTMLSCAKQRKDLRPAAPIPLA